MKVYGFGGIAPLVLNLRLSDGGEWLLLQRGRLTPDAERSIPTEYEATWTSETGWAFLMCEKSLVPEWQKPKDSSDTQPVVQSLYWLQYPGSLTVPVITRQTKYVHRNTDVSSRNHCCNGKSVSITQPECLFEALGIQHAMRMRLNAICDLSGSTIFFHIIS